MLHVRCLTPAPGFWDSLRDRALIRGLATWAVALVCCLVLEGGAVAFSVGSDDVFCATDATSWPGEPQTTCVVGDDADAVQWSAFLSP